MGLAGNETLQTKIRFPSRYICGSWCWQIEWISFFHFLLFSVFHFSYVWIRRGFSLSFLFLVHVLKWVSMADDNMTVSWMYELIFNESFFPFDAKLCFCKSEDNIFSAWFGFQELEVLSLQDVYSFPVFSLVEMFMLGSDNFIFSDLTFHVRRWMGGVLYIMFSGYILMHQTER